MEKVVQGLRILLENNKEVKLLPLVNYETDIKRRGENQRNLAQRENWLSGIKEEPINLSDTLK